MKKTLSITALATALIFSVVLFFTSSAHATLVIPNSLENTPGNTNNLLPWNCTFNGLIDSLRYQQVYLNTQFPGKNNINALRFRLDEVFNGGFGPTTLPNVEIIMSTTQKDPGGLSPLFDSNLGPDRRKVLVGPLTLSAPDCTTSPCPFDILVPFQFPFQYDPAAGNLIVDVKIFECVDLGPLSEVFDADDSFIPDTISRASTSVGGSADSPTAQLIDNIGLVTEFELARFGPVTLIPTLSEWGLIAMAGVLGIIGLLALRRRAAA